MKVELRRITEDEWALWRLLRREALADAPAAFGSTLAEWTGFGDTEERWRRRLRAVPFNMVAYLEGRAIGMVSAILAHGPTAELLSMWVAPGARGRGVGDALVGAVIDQAMVCLMEQVVLDVRAANAHAIALYRRHGFVDAGPTPEQAAGEPPELRMVLRLPAS